MRRHQLFPWSCDAPSKQTAQKHCNSSINFFAGVMSRNKNWCMNFFQSQMAGKRIHAWIRKNLCKQVRRSSAATPSHVFQHSSVVSLFAIMQKILPREPTSSVFPHFCVLGSLAAVRRRRHHRRQWVRRITRRLKQDHHPPIAMSWWVRWMNGTTNPSEPENWNFLPPTTEDSKFLKFTTLSSKFGQNHSCFFKIWSKPQLANRTTNPSKPEVRPQTVRRLKTLTTSRENLFFSQTVVKIHQTVCRPLPSSCVSPVRCPKQNAAGQVSTELKMNAQTGAFFDNTKTTTWQKQRKTNWRADKGDFVRGCHI